MSSPYAPIYYVSKETIDQLYREQFDPIEKVTKASAKGFRGHLGAKVGLSKLLSTILKLDGKAATQASSEKVIRQEVAVNSVDHMLNIIDTMFDSDSVVDIQNLKDNEEDYRFFAFNLPLSFSIEGDEDGSVHDTLLHDSRREGVNIRATYSGDDFKISGIISAEKWTTTSILLNFLEQIRDERGATTDVAGVLHPVNTQSYGGTTEITVQYLFFCSPSVYNA